MILIACKTLILQSIANAEEKICEIKYGEQSLNQQSKINIISRSINNQKIEACHVIGFEYDRFGNEKKDSPIYACCIPS